MAPQRVVIVGGGLAGFRTAQSLRANGFTEEIVLVGDEVHQPYDRPPLSKQLLAGACTPQQCRLPGEAADVSWRLGIAATGLDRQSSEVLLADGSRLSYDRLVIATGRRARPWPGQRPDHGVLTLRSLEDVRRLENALLPGAKVIIVGAGFIGCEVAATLRNRNVSVTIVDVSEHPMPVLGPEAGARAVRLHEAHGVTFRLGVGVQHIEGTEHVTAVVVEGGERLEADIVLVAIGSEPNTEWLAGAGLQLDRGVVVCDATGTVLDVDGEPVDALLAAGDVAAWPHPDASGAVCIEHWSNARDMGDAAAANVMVDHPHRQAIRSVPAFWSDQYDIKVKAAGFLRAADVLTVVAEDPDKPSLLIEATSEGRVVGAIAFNMNRAMIGYQRDLASVLVTSS